MGEGDGSGLTDAEGRAVGLDGDGGPGGVEREVEGRGRGDVPEGVGLPDEDGVGPLGCGEGRGPDGTGVDGVLDDGASLDAADGERSVACHPIEGARAGVVEERHDGRRKIDTRHQRRQQPGLVDGEGPMVRERRAGDGVERARGRLVAEEVEADAGGRWDVAPRLHGERAAAIDAALDGDAVGRRSIDVDLETAAGSEGETAVDHERADAPHPSRQDRAGAGHVGRDRAVPPESASRDHHVADRIEGAPVERRRAARLDVGAGRGEGAAGSDAHGALIGRQIAAERALSDLDRAEIVPTRRGRIDRQRLGGGNGERALVAESRGSDGDRARSGSPAVDRPQPRASREQLQSIDHRVAANGHEAEIDRTVGIGGDVEVAEDYLPRHACRSDDVEVVEFPLAVDVDMESPRADDGVGIRLAEVEADAVGHPRHKAVERVREWRVRTRAAVAGGRVDIRRKRIRDGGEIPDSKAVGGGSADGGVGLKARLEGEGSVGRDPALIDEFDRRGGEPADRAAVAVDRDPRSDGERLALRTAARDADVLRGSAEDDLAGTVDRLCAPLEAEFAGQIKALLAKLRADADRRAIEREATPDGDRLGKDRHVRRERHALERSAALAVRHIEVGVATRLDSASDDRAPGELPLLRQCGARADTEDGAGVVERALDADATGRLDPSRDREVGEIDAG